MRIAFNIILGTAACLSASIAVAMDMPTIERVTVNSDQSTINIRLSSVVESGFINYERYGSGSGYDYSQLHYRVDNKSSIELDVGSDFVMSGTVGRQTITVRLCHELHDATQSISCGTEYPITIDIGAPTGFPDVPDSYRYASAINYARTHGIVSGHPDGMFHPDAGINRAEFTKVITLALFGQEMVNKCATVYTFSDVPHDVWYAKYICRARDGWLLTGYPDGTFHPAQDINFSEAAKILANGYGLIRRTEDCNGKLCPDTDTPEHPWYEQYVRALEHQQAIPMAITRFDQPVTRGLMTEIIYRLEAGITDKPSQSYAGLAGTNASDTTQYQLLGLPSYTVQNYKRNTVYLYAITAPTHTDAVIKSQSFTIRGGRWTGPQIAVYESSALSNQIDTWASDDNWTNADTATLRGFLTIPAGETRYMLLTVNIGTPADLGFSVRVKHELLPEVVLTDGK